MAAPAVDAPSPAASTALPDHELRVPDCPYGYDFLHAASIDKRKGSLYNTAGRQLSKIWLAWRQFDVPAITDEASVLEAHLESYRDFIKANRLNPKVVLAAAIWSSEMCGEIPSLESTNKLFPPELQASHPNSVPPRYRISRLLWEENLCVCGITHSRGGSTVDEPIVVSSGFNTPEPEAAKPAAPKADTPIKLKKELGDTFLTPPPTVRKRQAVGAIPRAKKLKH
ncbi:hypothetical protein Dda_6945 [Drechslerella dactyloides]|uniref:Uncharacterized protein n=1 Tax=Drechslerella dactyloides TaxID=74499 RepID=A0AAD6ISV6_DREDA|nr:hypothetical protein Dda_6945 [Drechslerella dactyloides]